MNLARSSATLPQTFGRRHAPQQKSTAGSDPEVLALVEEIRNLRLKENAAKTRIQKAEACSNTRDKQRQALLKNKGREQLIARVEEIEAAKEDGRKMFAAVRALKLCTPTSLRMVDKEGRAVHNITTQVQILTNHFHGQFAPESHTPIPPPQPLTLVHPVTHEEVTEAAASLCN